MKKISEKDGRGKFNFYLDSETFERFKRAAAEEEKSISQLGREIVLQYLNYRDSQKVLFEEVEDVVSVPT